MLPKNSSCVGYYEAKQAKREAKEQRLRREKEKAERLAAQEAEHSARLAKVRAAADYRRYGYSYSSYYSKPAVQEKEEKPEFPNRLIKEGAYNKIVMAPNSNSRRKMRSPAPMDIISEDFGNKGFGKIKGIEITTRWSSSYV